MFVAWEGAVQEEVRHTSQLTGESRWAPLVSVITPSYNQGKFIEETIASVRRQDYGHIEHIIVDGGSTDGTVDIIRKYMGTYRVRYISEPDGGQAHAVNKGLRLAQGEIIGWLNSDDVYFATDTVRRVVEAFKTYPDTDVVYGDMALINEHGVILKILCFPPFHYPRMLRGDYIGQPAAFFRSSLIKKHPLDVSLQFAMDYEFWLRVGRTYRFRHVSVILAADRNHPGRKILARRGEMLRESVEVRRRYGQTFGLAYYCGRLGDKAIAGAFGRLKGAFYLIGLYITPTEERLFPRRGAFLPTLWNQLVRKNASLR